MLKCYFSENKLNSRKTFLFLWLYLSLESRLCLLLSLCTGQEVDVQTVKSVFLPLWCFICYFFLQMIASDILLFTFLISEFSSGFVDQSDTLLGPRWPGPGWLLQLPAQSVRSGGGAAEVSVMSHTLITLTALLFITLTCWDMDLQSRSLWSSSHLTWETTFWSSEVDHVLVSLTSLTNRITWVQAPTSDGPVCSALH